MELEADMSVESRVPSIGEVVVQTALAVAENATRLATDLVNNYTLNTANDAMLQQTAIAIPHLPVLPIEGNGTMAMMNSTEPPIEDDELRLFHAPQLSNVGLVKVYVLTVMALLSLLGNVLTMWNIYKTRIARRNSRHSWSAIYSLIFHLSIADVLVTGFCIIGEAAWGYTVQWLAGDLTCKAFKLFQMFSLYLSTYVLVLIGVDRWIAVKYPMKSLNMAKRCHRLLGGTYVFSFLLSTPQFFIFRVARGPFIEEFHQCVTHGSYTAQWQEQLYATITLVFTFLLPLCILVGTYLSTVLTISSSEKMFQGSKLAAYSSNSQTSTQTNRQRLIHKAKMKSLRISVVIIFAFLICWTPYYVKMMILLFSDPQKEVDEDLHSAIFFFGMSNSLVNPLIYGAFHLCPMDRKSGKHSSNQLNRGDSQRTVLTAVTQVDSSGRQLRTYRQPSYYRTHSNGSSSYKEHVSLLQVTPTAALMNRRSASLRSPHPNHSTQVFGAAVAALPVAAVGGSTVGVHLANNNSQVSYLPQQHLQHLHQHQQQQQQQQYLNHHHHHPSLQLIGNGGNCGVPQTAIVFNFSDNKTGVGVSALRPNSTGGSLNAVSIIGRKSAAAVGSVGVNTSLHGHVCADESVSSV